MSTLQLFYGRDTIKHLSSVLLIIAFGAVMFSAISAAVADEVCAQIFVDNETDSQFSTSGSVDGEWHAVFCGAQCGIANSDGSPPSTLPPHKEIIFASCSNGGLFPSGTGGSLKISSPDVGTLTWSAPWSLANGLGGSCGSGVNPTGGFQTFTLSGGATGMSQNPTVCGYVFGITGIGVTRSFQTMSPQNADQIFVLGTDRKLWLEHAPFGKIPPGRTEVDANVLTFQGLDNQTVLVLGTDGKLWLEHAPFGNVPPNRQQVDGTVRAFQGLDNQTVLVLGTDGKLWLEHAPFGNVPPNRQQVDGNVRAFQGLIANVTVMVLGTDGKLWLENAPFGNVPPSRQQVDGNVRAFQGFQSLIGGVTALVLGTDGNLWLEHQPFGNVPPGRQQVDGNVRAFYGLDDGNQTVLVLGIDGKLWLEHAPFGTVPPVRTEIDANVL